MVGPTDRNEDAQIRTFLIADVRGWTLFTHERGDEAAAKLAAKFADLAKECIESRDGSLIELRGDEALAVFSSPRQAIRAALDMQARFVEETVAEPALPLPVGIGLDAGEAVPVAGGYRGGALNLAARLCGQAGPGEVLASAEVIHLARKVDGVIYVDRGPVRLKGLEDPVNVIRVLPEGEDPAVLLKSFAPARPPSRPERRRGRLPLITAAVVLVVALVAAVVVPVLRDHGSVEPLAGNGVQLLDAGSHAIKGTVPTSGSPGGIASGAGAIWVTDTQAGSLKKIDPATHAMVDTVPVGPGASGVAFGAGAVWVAASDVGVVVRVDPTSDLVVARISVGNGPSAVAATDAAVWVANFSDDTVTRIDPSSSAVVGGPISVGDGPTAIAADPSGAWVTSINDGLLTRIEATSGSTSSVRVGNGPEGVATAADAVWVTNSLDGTLTEVDPGAMAIAATIPIGDGPAGISYGSGSLWVANRYGGRIANVDPSSSTPTDITVAGEPVSSTVAGGLVWVATLASSTSHVGGTLRVEDQYPHGPIDPAVAWDPAAYSILSLTSDGLVAFLRVGGPQGAALVPDLATSVPRPSDGGKTYTFQLRSGIRYSDGTPVRAGDFRLALERMFAQASPLAPYFGNIVGADACVKDPATCDLSEGVVTTEDPPTVTFHLTAPDPLLLNALTLPAAFAVPQGTPMTRVAPIPGTGPYRIVSYEPGKSGSIRFERNPLFREWSRAAKPAGYPDAIEWSFGVSPDALVAAVERGEADVARQPTPAQFRQLRVRYPSRVYQQTTTTQGFVMDVRSPPLDDVLVRRAIQFAVDRHRMIAGGGAPGGSSITCQTLPPGFPSYRPYCPYTRAPSAKGTWSGPDLRKALGLVSSSGDKGAAIVVWAPAMAEPAAREVARALETLGYRASVHIVPSLVAYWPALYDPATKIQIGWDWWSPDFPVPAGFFQLLFSCGNVPPNGSGANVSYFCDPAVERAMRRASALQVTDPAAAGAAWADVDRMITDRSPWLAYVNPRDLYFVSERTGNVQFNPQGLLLDQLWVR